VGVPFTDTAIATAEADVKGKTEITALVAYLQQLGTVMSNRR
jgi:cytochrome c oxidase cbb3-type subunit 2